ncbi:hypothetical protein GCM10023191_083630 [Actinoallomurus oryzae]|uniref:Uncharacterized protein n=1 Tax=Actinoallomurus oryzae TaxID=502180 RepID=A0ABP8R083_9ACTN
MTGAVARGEPNAGPVAAGVGADDKEWPFGPPAEWPPEEHALSANTKTTKMIRIALSKTRASPYWSDYRV